MTLSKKDLWVRFSQADISGKNVTRVYFSSLVLPFSCWFLNKTRIWPWLQLCSGSSFPNCIDYPGYDFLSYFKEKICSVNYAILVFTLLLCLWEILEILQTQGQFQNTWTVISILSFMSDFVREIGISIQCQPPLFGIAANFHHSLYCSLLVWFVLGFFLEGLVVSP